MWGITLDQASGGVASSCCRRQQAARVRRWCGQCHLSARLPPPSMGPIASTNTGDLAAAGVGASEAVPRRSGVGGGAAAA